MVGMVRQAGCGEGSEGGATRGTPQTLPANVLALVRVLPLVTCLP